MSVISRITTWTFQQYLTYIALNNEFNNIVNWVNNTDSGSAVLTSPSAAALTVTGNQTVGGTLGVTGNTTVGGTLGVTGAATVGSLTATSISLITNGTYAPTTSSGFGTIANASGFYQQIGNMVHTWGSFETGTVAGSVAELYVPVGTIVYTNRAPTNGSQMIGTFSNLVAASPFASGTGAVIFLDGSTNNGVFMATVGPASGTAAWPKSNASAISNNTSYCTFDYWYAVS